MKCKVLEDADAWSVVEEGLETLEDGCGKGRLLDVAVEVGVGVEDEGAAEVEEERVVVEFVVGEFNFFHPDEHEPEYDLNVWEEEDDEDEAFEIEFPVGLDTEGVADGEEDVAEEGCYPVHCSWLLGTQELESLHCPVGSQGTFTYVHVGEGSKRHDYRVANAY